MVEKKKKTLLLVFIHGFKGGDDTFDGFPRHLAALVQATLPDLKIAAITYPRFETRGDLHAAVVHFKDWLQNKVIDIEAANKTPSPTIDPSVRTILVGHSMGGIVAAETLLSISRDKPIPLDSPSTNTTVIDYKAKSQSEPADTDDYSSLLFPYIQGVLAFDTPYLGISPGVVAHGAEDKWATASQAYQAYTSVSSAFGWNSPKPNASVDAGKMLSSAGTAAGNASAAGGWGKWGKYAMLAAGAAAVAGSGAAAYRNRQALTNGFSWVSGHLEFVSCLARGEELRNRVAAVTKLSENMGLGFANIHTTLGNAVQGKSEWSTGVLGPDRTFCNVPKDKGKLKDGQGQRWWEARNDVATDEIGAHMTMFTPQSNPGYYVMSEKAKDLVIEWVEAAWLEDAEEGSDVKIEGKAEAAEQQRQDKREKPWETAAAADANVRAD